MLGAPKCCSHTARGKCVPGANNSVSEKFSFAVALTKKLPKVVLSVCRAMLVQKLTYEDEYVSAQEGELRAAARGSR